ncbi:hypothetical protein SS50377_27345 [Spironucleus salmonicida]|uniref:Uncharacterized protein n=1 Tax=Spironucleus salmonicida TaxID=348837 RepID=V6LRE3_9EUKA|nr:hypothetical protein SS50377_27345 [Spironucleus salmonicida]|eukprot:EST43354.1 hypothetical protein SS50377_17032 [Spironucleus salmonicida]
MSQNEVNQSMEIADNFINTTNLSIYYDTFNSYYVSQDMLKPVFIDVPVLTPSNDLIVDGEYQYSSKMRLGYLLKVNFANQTAMVKCIIKNAPQSLLIGTQIIKQDNLPSFIYKEVPLKQVTLLYSFQKISCYPKFITDMLDIPPNASDYEYLKTIFQNIKGQDFIDLVIFVKYVEYLQQLGEKDIYPDNGDIENLEPFHFRTKPKTLNTHYFLYEKLLPKLTQQMIDNRNLLTVLPFKFYTSQLYWQNTVQTWKQRQEKDLQIEEIKLKLSNSLALSLVYIQFQQTFAEYIESFFQALLDSIMEGSDCQSIMITLLEELDGLISQIISTEQVTHSLASKLQITSQCQYKKVNINIKLISDEMKIIREELDIIQQQSNDYICCVNKSEDFILPRFVQQLILIIIKILPLFSYLISYQLYFEVIEEQLNKFEAPKSKSHHQKISIPQYNFQFITIPQAFKLVQCTQSSVLQKLFTPVISNILEFLTQQPRTPQTYSQNQFFESFMAELGTILTNKLHDSLFYFIIPLKFQLDIVQSSLRFQLDADPNRTIWYFEMIMNLLLDLLTVQQCYLVKGINYLQPYLTNSTIQYSVETFCSFNNLPGVSEEKQFELGEIANFENYISANKKLFQNDRNIILYQKLSQDILSKRCSMMQESIIIFTNSIQKFIKLDQFLNNFMSWKQFNITAQYLKLIIEMDVVPAEGFIYNEKQLSKFIITKLQANDAKLDLSPFVEQLDTINDYRHLVINLNQMHLHCYFMQFDIGDAVDILLHHLNTCIDTMQNQVLLMIVEVSQKLATEILHLKNLLIIGLCSPDKFDVIQAILRVFDFPTVKKLIQDIFDITIHNINVFYSLFSKYDLENHLAIDIEPFTKIIYSPIIAVAQFAQARKKAVFDINAQHVQLSKVLKQAYNQMAAVAVRTGKYIKRLFEIDYIDLQDMAKNPLKFAEKHEILTEIYEIPTVQIACDDNNLLLSFLQALAKSTLLDIRTAELSNGELLQNFMRVQQKGELNIEEFICIYEKFDYKNIPIGSIVPQPDLRKLVSEAKFYTKELISVFGFLKGFIAYLVKVNPQMKDELDFKNLAQFPSCFSMNISVSPLTEVLQGLYVLQEFHQKYITQPLKQYPSILLLQTVERICSSINLVRKRIQEGKFVLYNNLWDYKITGKYKSQEDFIAFTVVYEHWHDYLIFAEDYVLKFIPSISFINLIQSKQLSSVHYKTLSLFLNMKEIDFTLPAQKYFEKFENDNVVYDIILILWQNATINSTATVVQQQIFSLLTQIIVENTFVNQIQDKQIPKVSLSKLKNQQFTAQSEVLVDINIVSYVVILPSYAETMCSECLSSCNLILNNIGYTGKFQISTDLYEFQRLQLFVSQQLNLTKNNQLPSKFYKFKDQLQQWRFDVEVEQFSRDLEAVIQLIHMTVSCLKRIPFLLQDMQIVFFNGSPIKDTSRLRQLDVNLLSDSQKISILQCVKSWQDILQSYFPKGIQIKIIDLCLDLEFCEKITSLVQVIQTIHEQLVYKSDQYIIQNYSQPFNFQTGKFMNDYAIDSELRIDISYVQKSIIPVLDGKQYPLGLLIPQTLQTKYLIFSASNNPIKYIQPLQNEVFYGCSDIVFDDKTGNILGIQSFDEVLTFSQPQKCPKSFVYLFDFILQQSGSEINQKCKNAYDTFYLCIISYNKQRQDQPPFYLHDLNESSKYDELQSYFKVFDNFLINQLFTEIVVTISTYISLSYKDLYQKAISGVIEKNDFRYIYFLINDLMVSVALIPGKHDYWRKAIICKLKEWQDIFQDTINLFLSRSNIKIVTENLQFPFFFYDQQQNTIVITDSRQSYTMKIGNHWLGRASIFDAYLKLSIKQLSILGKILLALSQKQCIFMVGSTEKRHSNADQNMLILALSRLLFRRFITVIITQFTFTKNLKKISICIAAGYIVQVIGIEFLPPNQLLELISLSNAINKNQGYLPGIVMAKDIYKDISEYQKKNKLETKGIKTQIQIINAEVQHFEYPGILLFYLPELLTIETSVEFQFSKAQQLSEQELKLKSSFASKKQREQQQDSNVVENYEIIYQTSQKAINLNNVFQNSVLINIESDSPLALYSSTSPQHGRAFYDISVFLKSLSQSYIDFTYNDISIIYNRAKDTADNLAVSIITLDFILRQSISLVNDSKLNAQFPTLVASFVCGAFGLDKNNSSILFQLAKTFQLQIDAALCHIGIINKNSTQPSYKKYNFQRYYTEFLQRYTNQQFQHYVQLFSSLHSLPLQCTFDILLCSEFLKQQKPLLLVTIHYSYLRIFLSSYVALRSQQLFYVTNGEQLTSVLRDMIKIDPSQPKPLIAVCPSSKEELMQLIDKLFGFQLAYPIIQDDYGLPYYQYDVKNTPNIILCIDLVLYNYLSQFQVMRIFNHRQLLLPNIEGAEGSRKTLLAGISVDPINISQLALNLQDLWMVNDNNLKFQTSSQAVLLLIKQYQSKMLLSTIKDGITQQVQQRSIVLPSFINGLFTILFDQVTSLFNIGRSYEELLIIRGILYFFLIRFKFITPQKRSTQNHFLNLAMDQINNFMNSEPRRKQMVSDMISDQNTSLGNDAMTRKVAQMYSEIQHTQKLEMASKNNITLNDEQQTLQPKDQIKIINDGLSINRMNVQERISPYIDVAGFVQEDMKSIEDHVKQLTSTNNIKLNQAIQLTLAKFSDKPASSKGFGAMGSLNFELSSSFIQDSFLQTESTKEAFINLIKPVTAAVWNAACLYFLTITNSGKWQWFTSKNGMQKVLQQRYDQFRQQLETLDRISILTTQSMLGMSILIANEENYPSLNKDCLKDLQLHTQLSIQNIDHNLLPDEVNIFVRQLFLTLKTTLPDYSTESFTYLLYQGSLNSNKESKFYRQFQSQIVFQQYKLGQGILKNTTIKSNNYTYDQDVKEICNQTISFRQQKMVERENQLRQERKKNTKDQESDLYNRLNKNNSQTHQNTANDTPLKQQQINPYDSDEENSSHIQTKKQFSSVDLVQDEMEELEQIDIQLVLQRQIPQEILSIESISDDTLYFDPHRTAIIVTLASCMITPVTICLSGERESGKSILIDVAKFVVRDICDSSLLLLGDLSSPSTSNSMRSAIASKFSLRNYYFASKSRYENANLSDVSTLIKLEHDERILDYQYNLCFPTFHVHASDVNDQEISSYVVQILRDHMIQLEGDLNNKLISSIQIDNQYQQLSGVVTLSDVSFIIECSQKSPLKSLAAVDIQIPPITEQFIFDLISYDFQDENDNWLKQFVHGIQLVKTSLNQGIQSNFRIIKQIYTNKLLTCSAASHSGEKLIDKINIYESNGVEIEDATTTSPVTQIFKNMFDKELNQVNIHSYFYSLRKIDQVDQLQIEAIAERLASLCLLGNLKSNAWQPKTKQQLLQKQFIQTPWSDSSILLEQNFSLYPAWETFIINESILNAKRPGNYDPEPLVNQFTLKIQNMQSIAIPNSLNSPLFQIPGLQVKELAIFSNYYQLNSFLFFHFMEIYRLRGQSHEPFLFTKLIEIYFRTNLRKERNKARLLSIMQFGNKIRNKNNLSGILAEDDTLSSKYYILGQGYKFAGYLITEYQKTDISVELQQLANEEKKLMNKQDLAQELQSSKGNFGGFSLISGLSLKPMKVYVKLNNSGSDCYEKLVLQYNNLLGSQLINFQPKTQENLQNKHKQADKSKFKVYTQEEIGQLFGAQPFSSFGSSKNEKFLVDLKGIYLQVINKQQDTSFFNDFELEIYKNLLQVYKIIENSPDFELKNSQFLIILVLLRMCVCASLGVKTAAVLPKNLTKKSQFKTAIGFDLISGLGSFLPSKVVPSSRRIAQLPYQLSSAGQLRSRIDGYGRTLQRGGGQLAQLRNKSKLSNTFSSKSTVHVGAQSFAIQSRTSQVSCAGTYNVQRNVSLPQSEIYASFQAPFKDITLVLPTSISSFKSPSDVSIWTLFSRILEPLSQLPTIFDQEELQTVIQLASFNFEIDAIMDQKLLSCLLAANFQVILVDDSPTNFQAQKPLKISDFGSIKSPILTLINNLPQKYSEILNQYIQQQQKSQINQSDKMLKAFAGANSRQQNQFDLYVKSKTAQCKNNVFSVSSRDLLALFKLSNCQNLTFETQNLSDLDPQFLRQQFAIASVAIYQHVSVYSARINVSLAKFTQFCATLTNEIFAKIDKFFTQKFLIANLLKFYALLAEPVKAPVKNVDLGVFSTETIQQQVMQNLQNQLNVLKQKKQNAPSERQIQLQTAAGESVFIRNYLHTISEILHDELQNQIQAAKAAHFNAICCAAKILFSEIDENRAFQDILSGVFGDVGYNVQNLINELKSNSDIDIYNILLICILRSHGIDCDLQMGHKAESEENMYYLGQNALTFGKNLFIYELAETLSLGWSIYQILNGFNIPWKPHDPEYSQLNSVMLSYVCGIRLFFVENEVAMPTSVLLAAKNQYSGDDDQLMNKCISKVQQINMNDFQYEAGVQKVLAALQSEDNIILITNVTSECQNLPMFHILRSLLQLLQLSKFQKDQLSEFLGHKFTSPRSSSEIPIVLGFEGNINVFIEDIGLPTQQFIDSCIFITTKGTQNKSIQFKQKYIQQSLIENVFGEKYGIRTRNEDVKLCQCVIRKLVEDTLSIFTGYIKTYILSQIYTPHELAQIKLDNHSIQRMFALTAQGEMMSKTLLYSSFLVNKNEDLKRDLQTIIDKFKQISSSLVTKAALLSTAEQTQDQAEGQKIKFIENFIVKNQVQQLASELSYAIGCTGIWLKQFVRHHMPVQSNTESDSLHLMFVKVKSDMEVYKTKIVEAYKDVPREKIQKTQQQTRFLVDDFPILYHVKNDYMTFKKHLISLFLPFLNKRLFSIFPVEYANAVWLCNSLLFLTLTNMITQQQDNQISTGELEAFMRIQQLMSKDTVRLITSYQLSQTFSQTSNFNLLKLYNESQLQNLFTIDNVKQIIPEICSISSQLQFAWLQLNIIARYSKQMHQSMPWFITNHASLVSLCQVNNPFLGIIYYFASKNPLAQSGYNDFLNQQFKIIETSKTKLIEVPPNFRVPDAVVFYLGFCMAIALKPESILDNMELMAQSMSNLFGSSPLQLKFSAQANAGTNSTAILTCEDANLVLTAIQCEVFVKPSFDQLLALLGQATEVDNAPFLSDNVFSTYNLIALAFQKLISYENRDNSVQSPLSVSVIYYDSCFQPDQFLFFCYKTLPACYKLPAKLFQVKNLTQSLAMNFATVLNVNPEMDGQQTLQSVIDLVKIKSSLLRFNLLYPIFILIPSSNQSISLNKYQQQGALTSNQDDFSNKLADLQNLQKLNYIYLQKPQTLKQAFLHVFCVSQISVNDQINQRIRKFNNIVSLRGFLIFCYRYALTITRITSNFRDQQIISIMTLIYNKTISSTTALGSNTPFLVQASADLLFFSQDQLISFDQIDTKVQNLSERNGKSLIFNNYALLDVFLPSSLAVSTSKSRGIDQKIKSQMNVKITEEEDEDIDSDNISESSRAQSIASSHKSAASELSDDEGEDFDDSMSMFSQKSSMTSKSSVSTVSAVSTASSINSTTFNRFDQQDAGDKIIEQNIYTNLLTTLSLQAGKLFKYTDQTQLEKSIEFLIMPKERKTRIFNVKDEHIDIDEEFSDYSRKSDTVNQKQALQIPKVVNYEQLFKFIQQLDVYTANPTFKQQQQMQLPNNQLIVRRVFSSQILQNVISELKLSEHHQVQQNSDLEKMPDQLKTYLQTLNSFQQINFQQVSNYLDPDILHENLLNIQVMMDHNLVLGTRGFGSFSTHWILSATVFAPILGDLFYFLKMQNSTISNASLDRQRVIISTEIPYKQPKVLDDGSIDFGKPSDVNEKEKSLQPFYLILRNFELVGLSYDLVNNTVCDMTPESVQGYCQSFDLYACVCVIDSWQTGTHDSKIQGDNKHLKVCNSYVPIPMKIGGYVRPIVFLQNKTKLPSEEFVKRGAFFAIKGI